MERKRQIPGPDGKLLNATEVGYRPSGEHWNEYLLDDGTLARVKLIVTGVYRFRRLGWDGPRRGTNHSFMVKGPRKARMPNPHHRKDIGVGLLDTILRQAGISRDEWLDASD